ncbi:TPA: hypothetical protein ACYZE8_001278 [Salmonella enterica]
MFCIWDGEVLAECGGALMPVASLYCLLIGGGLRDVDVMPLTSKRIFAFYLYTKDTFTCPLCRDKQIPLFVAFSLSVWLKIHSHFFSSFSREKLEMGG